jgi:hypothetical protein
MCIWIWKTLAALVPVPVGVRVRVRVCLYISVSVSVSESISTYCMFKIMIMNMFMFTGMDIDVDTDTSTDANTARVYSAERQNFLRIKPRKGVPFDRKICGKLKLFRIIPRKGTLQYNSRKVWTFHKIYYWKACLSAVWSAENSDFLQIKCGKFPLFMYISAKSKQNPKIFSGV